MDPQEGSGQTVFKHASKSSTQAGCGQCKLGFQGAGSEAVSDMEKLEYRFMAMKPSQTPK
jgi:ribosomal protein L34E